MSRAVNVTDPEDLSDEDLAYLWQRDKLPAELKAQLRLPDQDGLDLLEAFRSVSLGRPITEVPNTGTANTVNDTVTMSREDYDKLLELAEAFQADPANDAARVAMVEEIERQEAQSSGQWADVEWDYDEDGDGQYLDGWNNDRRRGELSKRGLVIDGSKQEMIDRLKRSDAGTLLDEDTPDTEDVDEDSDEETE